MFVCIANIVLNNVLKIVTKRDSSFIDTAMELSFVEKHQKMTTQADSQLNSLIIIQHMSEAYSLALGDYLLLLDYFSIFPHYICLFFDPWETNTKCRIPLAGIGLLC